jgi:NitT/TauT family transport system permease protein
MLAAYILSLTFALTYGYAAAARKWAEKVLLPALDVLQSVPVLGFFPVAVGFFILLFRGERVGIELASVFLIFTSQAWNMAFGVYESTTTIPKDILRATASYGTRGWLKFKRLYFPASLPKLVYNSMMSWAGGWYFLMACEIIALGARRFTLPGLGSFLLDSSDKGRVDLILLGLAVLILIIVALDALFWRPLTSWAKKFTYQMTPAGQTTPQSVWLSQIKDMFILFRFNRGWVALLRLARIVNQPINNLIRRVENLRAWPRIKRALRSISLAVLAAAALYGTYWALQGLMRLFSHPIPSEAKAIPLSILASFLRLAMAYILCLAWTVPTAVLIGENERVSRFLMPLIQVTASIPATALFPLIVVVVVHHLWGGMNLASILLILTGMQWYVLFNLIAGVRAIPADLKEAVRSFGVSRWSYLRRVLLPGIFPSLITGSITGWGGGWNALIVSEYLRFQGKTRTVFGIGMLLDKATYETGNSLMILLCLVGIIMVIVLMNQLLWRKLYAKASTKYVIEL